ncbi:hypothetical protein [Methanosarcina vacuolata]|uniref:NurA domain-containing protein n=1 Tax=Methanosarcina vacuolata Z-761 TaxID=1434123 RepID=A0A0E3Q754_9EURY|nr:hypothetical protein [Methanosarcina vacuolata]AKB44725.1 hypothetical protein MSVAZ_2456 [Methanosarcina vacuolata Z-761]
MEKIHFSNNFFLHPQFKEKVESIKRDIDLPQIPISPNIVKDDYHSSSGKLTLEEEFNNIALDALKGKNLINQYMFLGYDESFDVFQVLEGTGYLTCHSLIMIDDDDYLASTCLSFNFYTRSKLLLEKNSDLKDANVVQTADVESMDNEDKIEVVFKRDYASDRNKFILSNVPENCILFIDGPFVGKQMTGFNIKLNAELLRKHIIPIFVVKNSSSNLVTDNTLELNGKFNSDMHWAHNYLGIGQRTNFFRYTDQVVPENSKVFCYIKPFQASPQRIEFHPTTYYIHKELVTQLMDVIFYFYLIQGETKNSQIRPIVIAEKFARENKKMYNLNKIMLESTFQPTMNQARGFR